MGFLNGFFLFALGTMALPVLIHILNRRRLRKVRFSTLEFIDEINKRRMSKINIRRWLVLLLRTLAVAFLVLAFARPTIRSNAAFLTPGGAPKHVVLCLDISYSMGAEEEKGTVFGRAQSMAKQVVDECGDRDVLNVVAFSTHAAALFETGTRNKQVVRKAIDDLAVSAGGTSVAAAVAAALQLTHAPDVATAEIYVISDFREGADSVIAPELPDNVRLVLLPVTDESIDNVSIDRIFTPRKLIRPGEAVRIGVSVTNYSRERATEFPLELSLDGKRKAEKLVNLAPASSATVTFAVSMTDRGTYRGRVSKNHDRLPIDDDRFLVFEVSQQIPVTLIRGKVRAAEGPTPSPAGYFYIEKALNPRESSEGEFGVEVIDESEIAIAKLPDKGVVIWTDPVGSDARRLDLVKRYVRGGGALLVFLGSDPRGAWRDRECLRYLGMDRASASERAEGERLVSFAGDHPIFSLFKEEELELFSQGRVAKYISATGVRADSVLASFDGDGPAMWESRRGDGRIITVATSPDLTNGNLPLSPMFLPFIHACVSYLASAGRSDPRRENLIGADLVFDLPPKWSVQTGDLRIRSENGEEFKPLFAGESDGEVEAVLPSPTDVGFYTLLADTARIMDACLNIDARESNLNARRLDRKFIGKASLIEPKSDLARGIRRERQGREIYGLLLVLAAAALATEAVLGRKA
jgi:hypothetical protein